MAYYPVNNQFGSSQYNNPQMGAGPMNFMDTYQSLTKPQTPWSPQANAMAGQNAAGTPVGAGASSYTPQTYNTGYTPQNFGLQSKVSVPGASNMYTDYMKQLLGQFGTATQTPVTAQNVSAQNVSMGQLGANPMDVVKSLQPLIQQGQNQAFAQAGQRFGAQGMLASTPYAGELGRQSAIASNQLANSYYTNVLGEAEKQQSLQAQIAQGNQQKQLEASMANQSAALQAAGLNKQQANMLAQLAGQMGGFGIQQQQMGMQAAMSADEMAKFNATLSQDTKKSAAQFGLTAQQLANQAQQFAASQGLNWAQLNEQQRASLADEALRKQQVGQQGQQFNLQAFMQWVQGGGDPNRFPGLGGVNPWNTAGQGNAINTQRGF